MRRPDSGHTKSDSHSHPAIQLSSRHPSCPPHSQSRHYEYHQVTDEQSGAHLHKPISTSVGACMLSYHGRTIGLHVFKTWGSRSPWDPECKARGFNALPEEVICEKGQLINPYIRIEISPTRHFFPPRKASHLWARAGSPRYGPRVYCAGIFLLSLPALDCYDTKVGRYHEEGYGPAVS